MIDYLEYYKTYPKTFVGNVIIEGASHENGGKISSKRARKRCFVTCYTCVMEKKRMEKKKKKKKKKKIKNQNNNFSFEKVWEKSTGTLNFWLCMRAPERTPSGSRD